MTSFESASAATSTATAAATSAPSPHIQLPPQLSDAVGSSPASASVLLAPSPENATSPSSAMVIPCQSTPTTPLPQAMDTTTPPSPSPMTSAISTASDHLTAALRTTTMVNIKTETPTTSINALQPAIMKRPRHKPGERKELLMLAVRDVQEENISMRKAATRYNLAKSSLCDYVRKNNIKLPNNRSRPATATIPPTCTNDDGSSGWGGGGGGDAVASLAAATTAIFNLPVSSSADGGLLFRGQQPHLQLTAPSALLGGGGVGGFTTSSTTTASNIGSSLNARLESPWHNVPGLPTQVPIRNWSSSGAAAAVAAAVSASSRSAATTTTTANLSASGSPKLTEPAHLNTPFSSPNSVATIAPPPSGITKNSGALTVPPAIFNPSTFICASDPLQVATTAPNTHLSDASTPLPTQFLPQHQNPNITLTTHLPPGLTLPAHVISTLPTAVTATSAAGSATTDDPVLSRSLAYTLVPSQPPPMVPTSTPQAAVPPGSQLPQLLFPGANTDLESLLFAAAASVSAPDRGSGGESIIGGGGVGGKQTLNFFDINKMVSEDFLRKIQMQTCFRSLLAASAAVAVDNRFPQPPPPAPAVVPGVANATSATTTTTPASTAVMMMSMNSDIFAVSSSSSGRRSSRNSKGITQLPRGPMAQAKELINFINKSPSPFHAVRSAVEILVNSGFRELSEGTNWSLAPNDCVFVTKNQSSLFAIAVGGAYKPGNGFGIIGAHTDSPCLRLKPFSERTKEGFVQLAVQTYGGGLWYTWFDRELCLAGRVIVRNSDNNSLEERLVHINRPVACVPSLAIHLNREANKSFSPNPEVHLAPILCTTLTEQLMHPVAENGECVVAGAAGQHPPALLRLIANELQCSPADLVDLELYFADCRPACLGGVHEEFIHAPRLDNQFSAYTATQALVNSLPSLKDDSLVRIVCLYDHEEVGSRSMQGANSVYSSQLLHRVFEALASNWSSTEPSLFERTMAASFLLSADQAHAVHPSWPEKHEPAHKPAFHQGMVLKHHCSQNYATNGLTSAIVKEVARRNQVPLQEFVIRQDLPCGSTIGPMISAQLGVMTADVGGAQLAMHSCREMTCTTSVGHAISLFTGFFEQLASIMAGLSFRP